MAIWSGWPTLDLFHHSMYMQVLSDNCKFNLIQFYLCRAFNNGYLSQNSFTDIYEFLQSQIRQMVNLSCDQSVIALNGCVTNFKVIVTFDSRGIYFSQSIFILTNGRMLKMNRKENHSISSQRTAELFVKKHKLKLKTLLKPSFSLITTLQQYCQCSPSPYLCI